MKPTIKVTGGEKYKAVIMAIAKQSMGVKAGILNNATTPDGEFIAVYGAANEFGTDRIPSRSFLRSTVKEQQNRWVDRIAKRLRNRTAERQSVEDALTEAGLMMADDIRSKISSNVMPVNAPSTIKAKIRKDGSDPGTLRDKFYMLKAIDFEVVKDVKPA